MKLVRGNEGERERERERPEHIVCVKCLGTYILYVITRERKARNVVSVLSVSVHAFCMS